jgi:hypothetical protein
VPVAIVSVITFCTGKDEKDRSKRFQQREKTIELLRRRGILVEWRCFPNAGFDLSLNDSKINDFCDVDYDLINSYKIDKHKVEEFRDIKNRLWIDDSKATNYLS